MHARSAHGAHDRDSHNGPGHRHDHMHGHGHGHGHGHDHDHDHTHGASERVLGIAFALTATFMVVEFLAGLWSQSLALLADAGHMLTDAGALALAWSATRLAARPADSRRSFGYQRLRVLAAFVNGCALIVIVAWIAVEAVQRFFAPVAADATTMLWVGSLGLAVNLVVFAMLRRGDSDDVNVSGAMLHVLGDLLGSVAAIAAAAVILWTGWLQVDPLLSLLVGALILRSAWALVRRSAHILLEGTPDSLDVAELRREIEAHVPAIREVHHVHVWLVGPQDISLTMHAAVGPDAHHASVLKDTKAFLARRFGITHATIEIEVEGCADDHGQPRPCG